MTEAFGGAARQVKASEKSSTQCTASAVRKDLVLVAFLEGGLLRGRRFLLVLRLPLIERLTINDLTARLLGHGNALGVGRILHPIGEAIAAEAGKIHHVDRKSTRLNSSHTVI